MDEASKTLSFYSTLLTPLLQGKILDIGAGVDPISEGAVIFDKDQGDAQFLDRYFPSNSFDVVFSSHCLEHMMDPREALKTWYSLVRPGGFLIIIVPDEDLYEQGHFPSIFNSDHKATFTISKSNSWSPRSYNILELCNLLGGNIFYLAQQSDNYDLAQKSHKYLGVLKFYFTRQLLRIEFFRRLSLYFRLLPIDQTSQSKSTLAQVCFIVEKLSK